MPNKIVWRPPFTKRGQPTWVPTKSLQLVDYTPSGGVVIGDTSAPLFGHAPQVAADIVVEWDFDNDGDFNQSVEDITTYVLAIETLQGRDWPSQLTGKAGPGHLRMTLRNDDDRFNYFNSSSPLNASPFSLKTGRKLRVRVSGTSNPDPTLYAKDRFRRADGALGSEEGGLAWSGPLANDFAISSQQAVASTAGQEHIATVDISQTAYYAQAQITQLGAGTNIAGLVYRYQDTTNYSLAVADQTANQLKLIDVVAGTPTTIQSGSFELYDGMTIGVLVSGVSVKMYLEGINVLTGTAIQTDETEVGIYGKRGASDAQTVKMDQFWVWSTLPTEVTGILWTGDVHDLNTSVQAGPEKYATVEGQGWLSRLAGQKAGPFTSTDGKPTGYMVGEILASAGLLHPPGFIDTGDITTGAFGVEQNDALELARKFEDVEFGFLHETNEGYIGYDSRTHRASETSAATFSDDSAAQFHYMTVEPLDWRREVFNRVIAGVASSIPTFQSVTTTSDTTLGAVSMPATVNAGDLLLAIISISADAAIATFYVPDGWVVLKEDNPTYTSKRVLAKVAIGNEDGTTLKFAETGAGTPCVDLETEVFTRTGWKKYHELSAAEDVRAIDLATGEPVWSRVTQVRRFVGTFDCLRVVAPGLDVLASLQHRWLVERNGVLQLVDTTDLQDDDLITAAQGMVRFGDCERTEVEEPGVWCPTTEHGTWLARRNETVYYTGNKP